MVTELDGQVLVKVDTHEGSIFVSAAVYLVTEC